MSLFAGCVLFVNFSLARYSGPDECGPASEYIQSQFVGQSEGKRTIYAHVTVATDSSNIQLVFTAVRQMLMERNVEDAGLGEF